MLSEVKDMSHMCRHFSSDSSEELVYDPIPSQSTSGEMRDSSLQPFYVHSSFCKIISAIHNSIFLQL